MKMKKSGIYYTLAVGTAVIVSLLIVSYLSALKKETKVVETVSDLKAYQKITANDVKLVSRPVSAVQPDAIKKVEDVVGKYTAMSMVPGTEVRNGELLKGVDRVAGILAQKNDPDLVMIGVPLQKTDIGTAINPGDHVNINGFIKNNQTMTTVSVEDRPVAKIETTDKNSNNGPVLYVMVPASKSKDLETAIVVGTIRVELLSKGEGQ